MLLHSLHRLKALGTVSCAMLMLLATACMDDSPGEDRDGITPTPVTFLFKLHGDATGQQDFIATTSDAEVIALARSQLQLPEAQRLLHINGTIASANPPLNLGWHWRFEDDQWTLAEVSAEVCDGTPQMVEQNLQYWLGLGRFCPWGAYAAAEQNAHSDVTGILVRFSAELEGVALNQRLSAVQSVAATRGIALEYVREGALDVHVWRFNEVVSRVQAENLAAVISAQVPDVLYAEPNFLMYLMGG